MDKPVSLLVHVEFQLQLSDERHGIKVAFFCEAGLQNFSLVHTTRKMREWHVKDARGAVCLLFTPPVAHKGIAIACKRNSLKNYGP